MQDAKPAAVEEEEMPLGSPGAVEGEGHRGRTRRSSGCISFSLCPPGLGQAGLGQWLQGPASLYTCTPFWQAAREGRED